MKKEIRATKAMSAVRAINYDDRMDRRTRRKTGNATGKEEDAPHAGFRTGHETLRQTEKIRRNSFGALTEP
ncbi:MAG: hypothetical protein UY77_C0002G0040 [Candidatus Uhrbacteria bacterium GW2011_GWA2_53_10]|uniref:Uncharacterized protein n=1 Tax=Candidatus Uhrbacteria bacterium GW2011_GWA2_53_10 TaxID=1618980 RepID=A0A0G1ZXZ1_9BACT|nr:MAG: hypothetical protein UY77_C0002G0040 [Candidatus Uhrbacteria bacterium GW2011_GWA2_53_10]